MTTPRFAECSDGGSAAGAEIEVDLDGARVASGGSIYNLEDGDTETITRPIIWLQASTSVAGSLYEPGVSTNHSLTARATQRCGTNNGHSGSHFTVDSVSIDVIGVR